MAADTRPGGEGGAAAGTAALPQPFSFRLLDTGAGTSWDPASASVTLNVRLDGCICPSEALPPARISYSHAVVLDDFIPDETRRQLLQFLLYGNETVRDVPDGRTVDGHAGQQQQEQRQQQQQHDPQQPGQREAEGQLALLSEARWERRTTDMAGAAPTWGVRQHVLQELASVQLPAMQEVHARLGELYPECDIAHLPSEAIQLSSSEAQPPPVQPGQEQECQAAGEQQPPVAQQAQQQDGQAEDVARPPKRSRTATDGGGAAAGAAAGAVDCACFVANAAVAGDVFRYHVDADPTSFPDGSPWHAAYGDYFNGEPGRPLLASLLLYLNDEWRREWGADTLFLDGQTDTGIFVAPRPCRAVLFDQDITHRVSAPSPAAGGRPRFSLVWKLALLPRQPGQALCLARPEWGPPMSFGSAARVDAVKRQLAAEQRQQRQQQQDGGSGGAGGHAEQP